MTGFSGLVKRDTKLFFKDKGIFFTSLITPLILLVLYATFLGKVYYDSFSSVLPQQLKVSDRLIKATAAGEMFSSLLAVSCITVSFCCNMLMVQDKATGARRDLTVSPVKKSVLALAYYFSTLISTLIICYIAMGACLIYVANVGWYMSAADIALTALDVFLLSLFGTALSSLINFFLTSQGQITAVGTIVSSGYGFICGAYMPLASFSEGLRNVILFLPGTYGTSLIRNHTLHGIFTEMESIGFPEDIITKIRDSVDCNLYFFGNKVSTGAMYSIVIGTVAVLIAAYILINIYVKRDN